MTSRTISKIQEKILIVGPIYDQIEKLDKIEEILPDYEFVIFNGNLCYPFEDIDKLRQRISKMNDYLLTNKVIYNCGGYDLKLFKILSDNGERADIQRWIINNPNVIIAQFDNASTVIIVGGGIPQNTVTQKALNDNVEVSFVSYCGDEPWHNYYLGRLGYIISNNPLTTDVPKFYPYSAQIGNKYGTNINVYAQEVDRYGLKQTISL